MKQTQKLNSSAESCAEPVGVGQVWADCWDLKGEWGDERRGRVLQSEGYAHTRARWGKRP